MTEFNYLSQKIVLDEEETVKLRSLNIPYVDVSIDKMSPADIVFNLQMLQKLTANQNAAIQAIEDNAVLKQRILELEADLVKYQKLYFAISRPPPS